VKDRDKLVEKVKIFKVLENGKKNEVLLQFGIKLKKK